MGGKTQTTTQNSSTTPTGLAQLGQIWNQVQNVASQPYTPYTGQLTAGLTGTQQSGINNINAAQGSATPYFDQAAQYATAGAAPISSSAIQNYQNPYTQQVVDATQAQFNANNANQQAQLLGNSAARGALGSRVGVNQADLARQQQAGQAPVIAGLYSQGYSQALGAAQQDRAAQAQAAYTFGALAPSVQNAALSGANAQLGAGAVEQGTNQAALSAQYQQYLQQLAFPYQQAGFLAQYGLPTVNSMGSSSTGTTTAPGPNPWSQIAGLGLTAASIFGAPFTGGASLAGLGGAGAGGAAAMLSDRRLKRDIKEVGETHDGQTIYSYRIGEGPTQLGLMAQEVERRHPEAVGDIGGVKTVDYDAATADAAKPHLALGGPVGFSDVMTYVPHSTGSPSVAPMSAHLPALPKQQQDLPAFSPQLLSSAAGGIRNIFGGSSSPFGMSSDDGAMLGRANGGRVGYADGGIIDLSPNDYVNRGFVDADNATRSGLFDSSGLNAVPDSVLAPRQTSPFAMTGDTVPMPRPRPMIAAPSIAPDASSNTDDGLPPQAMAFNAPAASAAPSPFAMTPAPSPAMPSAANAEPVMSSAPSSSDWSLSNPFNLSEDARMALLSAGLGMMASRSPFALSAIGEGGQAGLKTYADATERRRKAEQQAAQLAHQASQLAETGRHNRSIEDLTREQRVMTQMQPVRLGNDALGRDIYGVRDPQTGSFKIVDPATGQLRTPTPAERGAVTQAPARVSETDATLPPTAQPVSAEAGARDEEFLKGLGKEDPSLPGLVRKIANYEISPSSVSMKGNRRERILGLVAQYDPDFDAAQYPARAAAIKEFTAGGPNAPAGNITSGNTAIQHLGQLAKLSEKIGGTNDWSILNKPINWLRANKQQWEMNPTLSQYVSALDRYSEEATKFYRGIGGTQADINRTLENLTAARSPEARAAALQQEAELMQSKISALQDRWKNALGGGNGWQAALRRAGINDYPIVQKKSEEALTAIHALAGRSGLPAEPAEPPKASAAPRPAVAPGAKIGERRQFRQGWGVWNGERWVPE